MPKRMHKHGAMVKTALTVAAVFVVSASVSLWLQPMYGFRDPDTFYHLRIAQRMSGVSDLGFAVSGHVPTFRWLPFTVLATEWSDHEWLYHVLLVPFVRSYEAVDAVRFATATFFGCVMVAAYLLMRAYRAPFALALTMLMGSSMPFLFRMNLGKPSALAVALLLLALAAQQVGATVLLFPIGIAYALLHGGWPLLIAVCGAFVVARVLVERYGSVHPYHSWGHRWLWKRLLVGHGRAWWHIAESREMQCFVFATAGCAVGFALHPDAPMNILFFLRQFVAIGVAGAPPEVAVGAEWGTYVMPALVRDAALPLSFVLGAALVSVLALFGTNTNGVRRGKIHGPSRVAVVALWLLAAALFTLTLRNRRHVEYFVPVAVCAGVVSLVATRERIGRSPLHALLHDAQSLPLFRTGLPLLLVVAAVCGAAKNVADTRRYSHDAVSITAFSGGAAWLQSNVPPGAVILNGEWDEFPPLFFRDDSHAYVVGLDAMFLHDASPRLYRAWHDISTGRDKEPAKSALAYFGAKYAILSKERQQAMLSAYRADRNAILRYEDDDTAIFSVNSRLLLP